MRAMRELSKSFMDDLLKGVLQPILERVQHDQTLMLAIRKNYINIYYRGGNILRLMEQGKGSYRASFDDRYNKSEEVVPVLPDIKSQVEARTWVDSFPCLKKIMDSSFSLYS